MYVYNTVIGGGGGHFIPDYIIPIWVYFQIVLLYKYYTRGTLTKSVLDSGHTYTTSIEMNVSS